jgi:hypothetical protein
MSAIGNTMKVSCIRVTFQNELTFRPLIPFDFLLSQKSSYLYIRLVIAFEGAVMNGARKLVGV